MFSDTIALTPDPAIFAIPLDFVLFGLTLIGVAVFHHHTMRVALVGLVTISIYKIAFTGFKTGPGMIGFVRKSSQPHFSAFFRTETIGGLLLLQSPFQ